MAKNKISEWSSVPANNTDVGGIDIAEGCAPSGINNAIREVMAQVKDMITGADGDNQVVGGNLTVNGTSTLTGAVAATAGVTGPITSSSATITGGTITGITDLAVADGGTGHSSLTANNLIMGNGTNAVAFVAPSTSGNVLTSNGTTWTSAIPAALGVNQTWQDVTGSRSIGTTYTNNTGKPIAVSIFKGLGSIQNAYWSISVNGVSIGASSQAYFNGANMQAFFIVPVGQTYIVTNGSGTTTPQIWAELR